jgi:hypothetical protein
MFNPPFSNGIILGEEFKDGMINKCYCNEDYKGDDR